MKEQSSLKPWLGVSLVLNLFLAGAIAGGAWRWWTVEVERAAAAPAAPAAAATAAQPRGLRFAADELSSEQRRAFRLGLREARREVASSIQAAREGRQEVLRLLAAPQLDQAAVTAALARTRDADMVSRARVEASVIDFATRLSPPEREKLAEGLARRSTLSPPPATAPRNP
ncbi:periplasmic heavy metal sensor [Variovorax sp. WS11]|uniref:periplasmic heavy metal sensor n=1 Tax=Variovorax sp. WS11 TaxID=1105204 RepID=UPI0015E65EEE|nr:periplasmic heavy metal sensor [Variovorax sp. WS11]